MKNIRILITGGGTGGHIFPAIAIADELKKQRPNCEILFVGAKNGMEETLIPKAGYPIETVEVTGIYRKITFNNIIKNLKLPFLLWNARKSIKKIIEKFEPQIVIGVGGYASYPALRCAISLKIKSVICEQNAYPGLVNRMLGKKVDLILLGNKDAETYFDKNKTVVTGNPVRENIVQVDKLEALKTFGFEADKPTVLILGGSLGAGSINSTILNDINKLINKDIQLIWQCGKGYHNQFLDNLNEHPNLYLVPFIEDMAVAYSAADLVVARAGALTISELISMSKPAILIPSPNVSDNHQFKNAQSLTGSGGCLLLEDEKLSNLTDLLLTNLQNKTQLLDMQQIMNQQPKQNSAKVMVEYILKLIF